jgi:hypothetical protein
MRKFLMVFGTLVIALSLTVLPVLAITGNFVDDFEHPFVGLAVFYDEEGEFSHRCSGSLLTPTVFLTAGHCTDGADSARVYFQQDAGANYDPETELDPVTGYPEFCAPGTEGFTCATSDKLYNYGFDNFASFPNTKDLGLVILDQPITLSEYGVLSAAGTLDPFKSQKGKQDLTVTVSGYGLTYSSPVFVVSFRERLMAEAKIVNLVSANTGGYNLQTTANPGDGKGGTCFGDSGGPVFYGDFSSNLIVGVTSFGFGFNRDVCAGVDFAYRTDRQEVIDWILDTVPEDQAELIEIVDIWE